MKGLTCFLVVVLQVMVTTTQGKHTPDLDKEMVLGRSLQMLEQTEPLTEDDASICSIFTENYCTEIQCKTTNTFEAVCCGGEQYDNCCQAVCENGVDFSTCEKGLCSSASIQISIPGPWPTPCEVCSMTVGAYIPYCCEGRQYNSPCFAEHCGNEDLSKCVEGFCGIGGSFLG
eukprot:TRINITY_DN3187_c0_g1_i1.p3 TRINITY_DN3187_c0_g1~~TRINITY_DN3187_c0_g1_i1.p3  ORF type:complete len:173 (-),score=11.90 TRINITY_DN3187_c0_g1_i1:548-1066(-)